MIPSYIPQCENDYMAKKDMNLIKINWNTTNIIAVVSKVLEVYSLASFAFRPDIEWKFNPETKIVVNSGLLHYKFYYI